MAKISPQVVRRRQAIQSQKSGWHLELQRYLLRKSVGQAWRHIKSNLLPWSSAERRSSIPDEVFTVRQHIGMIEISLRVKPRGVFHTNRTIEGRF